MRKSLKNKYKRSLIEGFNEEIKPRVISDFTETSKSISLRDSQKHIEIDYEQYEYQIFLIQDYFRKYLRKKQKNEKLVFAQIIDEAYNNEKQYCEYLEIIIEKILKKSDGLLTQIEKETIFSNIEQIYELNTQYLSIFDLMRQKKLDKIDFLDSLIKLSHFFQIYFQYISDQSKGQELRQQMQDSNHKFIKHFKAMNNEQEFKFQDMESLFIKPLQKLVNYELLLQRITKNVSKHDQIYDKVQQLYNKFKDINNKCNEQVTMKQTQEQLGFLQNQFSNEEILIPSRTFISKEELFLVQGVTQILVYLYICNDAIIIILKQDDTNKEEKFKFLITYDQNSSIIQQKQKKYLTNGFLFISEQGCCLFSCLNNEKYQQIMETLNQTIKKFAQKCEKNQFQIYMKNIQDDVDQLQKKYNKMEIIKQGRHFLFKEDLIFSVNNTYFSSTCYFFQDLLILCETDQNLEIIQTFYLDETSEIVNYDIEDFDIFQFQIKTNKKFITILCKSVQDQLCLMKKIQNNILCQINKSDILVSVKGIIQRLNQQLFMLQFQWKDKFQLLHISFDQLIHIQKQFTKKFKQIKVPNLGKINQFEWSDRLIEQDKKLKIQIFVQNLISHQVSKQNPEFILSLIPLNKEFYQKFYIFDELKQELSLEEKPNQMNLFNIRLKQIKTEKRVYSNISLKNQFLYQENVYLMNDEPILVNIYQDTTTINVIQQIAFQRDILSFLDFKIYIKCKQYNEMFQLDYDEKIENVKTFFGYPIQFYLVKYLYLPIEIERLDQIKEKISLNLIQINYNIQNMNYKLTCEQYVNYASLKIYLKYFISNSIPMDEKFILKAIQEFVPKKIFQSKDKDYWKNYISQILKHLKFKYETKKEENEQFTPEKVKYQNLKLQKIDTNSETRSKSQLAQLFSTIYKVITPKKLQKDEHFFQRTQSQTKENNQISSAKKQSIFDVQKQIIKEISKCEFYGYQHFQFVIDQEEPFYKIPLFNQQKIILSVGYQQLMLLMPNSLNKLLVIEYQSITSFYHDQMIILVFLNILD